MNFGQKKETKNRLIILGLLLMSMQPSHAAFNIEKATIESLQTAIQNKQTNCQSIIQSYLERIQKFNLSVNDKPPINAFTQINPYVVEEAQKLDDYYAEKQKFQGPLHCVPVILKDNINTKDMLTTGGSFALLGNQPVEDAFLVAKLRAAGAIFIGKAGMDEFGWGLIGISSRTGRIGNAYNTNENPGGSSGGVAAAVSANFAVVGIGTDNSGSIRVPAAFNGIFGLRPSIGLISQQGIIPMGNLDAVAGPMARTMSDLARVLTVIADSSDPKDKKTHNIYRTSYFPQWLKDNALKNKRIGIVRKVGRMHPFKDMPNEAQIVFKGALQQLKNTGAVIIDNINLPEYQINRRFNQAGEAEDVNEYLASFPAARENFQDICNSNRTRTFGTKAECINFVETLPSRNSTEYTEVLTIINDNRKYVEAMMEEYDLAALMLPVTSHGSATYDVFSINTWVAPLASNAGLPSIVLNAGYMSSGMPMGIELVTKQFQETQLIAMAYTYEMATPARIPPTLIASKKSFAQYSIADMNNIFTQLGAKSYTEVLMGQDKEALTPQVFKKIFNAQMDVRQ